MTGYEFSKSSHLSTFERLYIRIFGFPALGLRVRTWRMMPLIKKYGMKSKSIMDLGSGRGVFTIEIAKNFPSAVVTGIDSEYKDKVVSAIEVADRTGISNCLFKVANVFDKNFKGTFDCIVAIDVFEHIQNDLAFAKIIREKLNSDGKLIIHVPHYYRNTFGIKRHNFSNIEGHQRIGYLMKDLESLLLQAGFAIIEKGYTYSSMETLSNDISYLLTGGREKRKIVYALFFPFLLAIALAGRRVRPKFGSGLYVIAKRS